MKNALLKHAALVGVVVVVFYVLCLLWKVTITDPEVANFHLLALKLAIPGFGGFSVGSIIWGAVVAFIYGFIFSVIFHKLHKNCCLSGK